jgi:serine/threonine protein kinase
LGSAKLIETEETMDMTGTGVGVGTPEYMAPEQAQGKLVDARSDIYALGIVLYEMLTGRKPYQADTPYAVVIKHVTEALPSPRIYAPSLPSKVEHILYKALAKNPENRYQSMAEFCSALERIGMTTPKAGMQSFRLLPAAIVGIVGALIFLAWTQWTRGDGGDHPEVSLSPHSASDQVSTASSPNATLPMSPVPTQEQPLVYDNFDDPVSDGSYDTYLWTVQYGSLPKPVQSDGRLRFFDKIKATDDHEIALRASGSRPTPLSEYDYIQADLGFGSDTNHIFSHVAMNLVVTDTPKGDFWIEANLINSTGAPALLCKIAYYGSQETKEYERPYYRGALEYDKLYTVRIELDKTTSTVRWILDNTTACEYTSKEFTTNMGRNAIVLINSNRVKNSIATTYVDNVYIGLP